MKKKYIVGLMLTAFLLVSGCTSSKARTSDETKIHAEHAAHDIDSLSKSSALLEGEELFSLGSREADIFWQSSEPTTTSLGYGKDKSSLKTVTTKTAEKIHYLHLRDLRPDATYYYRINGVKEAKVHEFKTLPEPGGKYLFSFAVCTDTHLTNSKPDQFGALYKESYGMFNSLVDEVNEEKVDFLVVKGDVSHDCEPLDYQVFFQALSHLKCKVYTVPGNHDKQDAGWGLFFRSFFPNNLTYYSFNHKNWHFILLDSATEQIERGHLGAAQLSWLEGDLKANTKRPTMIFMHHLARRTLFTEAERFFIDDSEAFLKVIKSYPVVAIHSGHAHLNNASSYGSTDFIVTAAVINYPIQYNVYHVYENGYVQVSHRLSSYLEQSEASKDTLALTYSVRFGIEPPLVGSFVEGDLQDRSFMRKIR